MSNSRLKLFMVIRVLLYILKSTHELYGNMKDLLRAIEIVEAANKQALPKDEGRTKLLFALSLL